MFSSNKIVTPKKRVNMAETLIILDSKSILAFVIFIGLWSNENVTILYITMFYIFLICF